MYKVLKFDSIIKHSKLETRYEKLTVFVFFREFKEIDTAFKLVHLELYFLGNILTASLSQTLARVSLLIFSFS